MLIDMEALMKGHLSLFFILALFTVSGCGGSSLGNPSLNLSTSLRLLDNFDQPVSSFNQNEVIKIELTIRNNGSENATLNFSNSQKTEFEVFNSNNALSWRFSSEVSFSQVSIEIVLQPGETDVFVYHWQPSLAVGDYRMRGWYLSYANTPEVTFRIQ